VTSLFVANFTVAAMVCAGLTGFVMRVAVRTGQMDIPNARSSHVTPTPRGGGVAVVLTVLGGVLLVWCTGALEGAAISGLILGGGAVAIVGYIDDKRPLSVTPRFLVHLFASIFAIVLLIDRTGVEKVFPGIPNLLGCVLLVLGVVWSINLFNFMDGIDGIAASQALFVTGASAGLIAATGGFDGWALVAGLTAGACAGFLTWNWPPARIFLGDVGSGFLGFWLAAFAIALQVSGRMSIWCSLILSMLFIADATVTLLRRIVTAQKWYEAHCSHAYQHLARRFGQHRAVTLGAWLMNLVILLPVALLAHRIESAAPWAAGSVFVVCSVMCFMVGAGKPPAS
jgi:Fuc2NAc and GlcNAc transferase